MSAPEFRLVLSRRASADIRTIQRYTARHWGPDQARVYDEAIVRALTMLQEHPDLGRDRGDLVPGLRSHPAGSHTIFYRVSGDTLTVRRILHQRMNVTPDQLT
jgi:toxin ParE1/3/4